jgi:hypothetical protein
MIERAFPVPNGGGWSSLTSMVEQWKDRLQMDTGIMIFGNDGIQRFNPEAVQLPIEEGLQLLVTFLQELPRSFMQKLTAGKEIEINRAEKDIIRLEREIDQAEDDIVGTKREIDQAEDDIIALGQEIADLNRGSYFEGFWEITSWNGSCQAEASVDGTVISFMIEDHS